MKAKFSSFSILWRFKMKTTPSERKRKTEKVRKERITLFNKANNLGLNGANVYVIVEYNGRYFIYNSRLDKEWPPSKAILVRDIIFAFVLSEGALTVRRIDIIRFQNGIHPRISVEEQRVLRGDLKRNGKRRLRVDIRS